MSKFKNMKIAVTHEQPLGDVVLELKRLGYRKEYESDEINYAITFNDGAFGLMTFDVSDCEETTILSEIKEMKP